MDDSDGMDTQKTHKRKCDTLEDGDDDVEYDGFLTMTYHNQDWVVTKSNTVYCCSMSIKIDLELFSQAAHLKYNPMFVPAVNYSLLFPKCTLMVYESGKVICLGGEFKIVQELAFQKMAMILRSYGFNRAFVTNVRLDNTTCVLKPIRTATTLHTTINLQMFSEHPAYRSYVHCPCNFNAALVQLDTRTVDGKGHSHRGVSAHVFSSGNCIILGTRNEDHMIAAACDAVKMLTRVIEEQRNGVVHENPYE